MIYQRFYKKIMHSPTTFSKSTGCSFHLGRLVPLGVFLLFLAMSFWVGRTMTPISQFQEQVLPQETAPDGSRFVRFQDQNIPLSEITPYHQSPLHPSNLNQSTLKQKLPEQALAKRTGSDGMPQVLELSVVRHWGGWSLLPALAAIILCFMLKEPLTALLGGLLVGGMLIGQYDVTRLLVNSIGQPGSAILLILYLWLLGGLSGIWGKTGAAQAFARFLSRHCVKGPVSAKLIAWTLGILMFQGGSISAVLVGTTVTPVADQEKISKEELSYIVDSTSSPVAVLLAFNAWPGFVQPLLIVSGVSFLATESDRLKFFFQCLPLSFYAILAVLGTFLLSIDKAPFIGRQMKKAIKRARSTGQLSAPGSRPLASREIDNTSGDYQPWVLEFVLPLAVLIGTALVTFWLCGAPQILWAFSAAFLLAGGIALMRGMSLNDLIDGVVDGLKSVVLGSVIILLAVTMGHISQQTGGGAFLVSLLSERLLSVYWLLPALLFGLSIVVAFSTGTSLGTYAVVFPLAMPLAWSLTLGLGLEESSAWLFMALCFASVLNGAVFGDQTSPISDTTVLSALCTGCDLMDHVRTQLPQAMAMAAIATVLWTLVAFFGCPQP